MTEPTMNPGIPACSDNKTALLNPPRQPGVPFVADRTDGLLALMAFALGFLFIRWVFFAWQGFGVSLFTYLFAASVVHYLRRKGISLKRESKFWLAVLLLAGTSYAVWPNLGLEPWKDLFLFLVAVYWVISATGIAILGMTSDWLPLDGLHALFVIPFRNFGSQYQSLAALRRQRSSANKQQLWAVGLGLALALLLMGVVVPLLVEADSGGFARLLQAVWQPLLWLRLDDIELAIQGILAIPTAAYIFALIAGSAHQRGAAGFKQELAERAVGSFRILPAATIHTVLGALVGLYLVFIGSQLPYFFSAFLGKRPEGWLLYAEYARRGFFELCSIAFINMLVLAAANLSSVKLRKDSAALRLLNCLLAGFTLLLIATAMSKMFLYISVYGLTMPRLLPCLFMVFLAVICAGVVALQRMEFSIMRLAAGTGTVILTTLLLINADGLVTSYNANRYLAGTLTDFDTAILHRAGPAGVNAALRVYAATTDPSIRSELEQYLSEQRYQSWGPYRTAKDTLQHLLVRQKLE